MADSWDDAFGNAEDMASNATHVTTGLARWRASDVDEFREFALTDVMFALLLEVRAARMMAEDNAEHLAQEIEYLRQAVGSVKDALNRLPVGPEGWYK